ncbi:hypothetical protein EV643_1421, partial [Kribbella sp. VKM Ac-2527]
CHDFLCPSFLCHDFLCPSFLCHDFLCPSFLCPSFLCPSFLCHDFLCPSFLCHDFLCPSFLCHDFLCRSFLCRRFFRHGSFRSGLLRNGSVHADGQLEVRPHERDLAVDQRHPQLGLFSGLSHHVYHFLFTPFHTHSVLSQYPSRNCVATARQGALRASSLSCSCRVSWTSGSRFSSLPNAPRVASADSRNAGTAHSIYSDS